VAAVQTGFKEMKQNGNLRFCKSLPFTHKDLIKSSTDFKSTIEAR
jgi:hypothetical protein